MIYIIPLKFDLIKLNKQTKHEIDVGRSIKATGRKWRWWSWKQAQAARLGQHVVLNELLTPECCTTELTVISKWWRRARCQCEQAVGAMGPFLSLRLQQENDHRGWLSR